MRRLSRFILFIPFLAAILNTSPARAQQSQISFDSFTGIYHLSQDKNGLSLLTSEETILVNFPGDTSLSGIKREIPESYQGHSVQVELQSVTDAAGNNVPYTSKSENGNLVITTGDPEITVYGNQTYKFKYQTSGVINVGSQSDQFLLNVNGRGWDSGFNKVNATLFIPSSFNSSLKSDPTCYTAIGDTTTANCQINTDKKDAETVITSSTGPVAAHEALILKLDFAASTFTNTRQKNQSTMIIAVAIFFMLALVFLYFRFKNNFKE